MGELGGEQYCYLTTTGRRTGSPHRIEIWFATEDDRTLLLLAGGREATDWVRNLVAEPAVTVEVRGTTYAATGRVLEEGERDDSTARRMLVEKYGPDGLHEWGRGALAVALTLADQKSEQPDF